jgi:hypothetical protein
MALAINVFVVFALDRAVHSRRNEGSHIRLPRLLSRRRRDEWSELRGGLSHQAIARIWGTFDLRPHCSGLFKLSIDPLFLDRLRDVLRMYLICFIRGLPKVPQDGE